MAQSNHISPGMTINLGDKIYRVEASTKVDMRGTPFIKTKLRDLINDEIIEKNFKLNEKIHEVALVEHQLEFLYLEGKDYLFLDIGNLEQVLVPAKILGDSINFLKEGIQIKALFYGNKIFSVELPQFLELMVVKTEPITDKLQMANTSKKAILETGATIDVPQFVEVGDIVKVDVNTKEYIQRV
jgi:elongation factor P